MLSSVEASGGVAVIPLPKSKRPEDRQKPKTPTDDSEEDGSTEVDPKLRKKSRKELLELLERKIADYDA